MSPAIFSDIERRSAWCYTAACIKKEEGEYYIELRALCFWLCLGFVAILMGSILPKYPPNDQVRSRAPSYFVRDKWQYGEGPRGGQMRRKVDYEYRPMERLKYVILPGAPWIRWPFAAYPYFVPEQDAQGRDVCTPFLDKFEHPLSDWMYTRAPRPARVYS